MLSGRARLCRRIPAGGAGGLFFFKPCISSVSFEGTMAGSAFDLRVAGVPRVGIGACPFAHSLATASGHPARLTIMLSSLSDKAIATIPVTGTRQPRFVITSWSYRGDGGGEVAMIDERARLPAGQARRMKHDSETAGRLLRRGNTEEAAELLRQIASYANFIAAWLEDITQPPREPPMRGKSRGR